MKLKLLKKRSLKLTRIKKSRVKRQASSWKKSDKQEMKQLKLRSNSRISKIDKSQKLNNSILILRNRKKAWSAAN